MSKYRRCFTLKRVKNGITLDGSSIDPKVVGSYGKDFEEKYRQHLDSLLLDNIGSEVNFNNFLFLLVIAEQIKQGSVPIQLRSNRSEPLKRRVINVLGAFLDEHYDTLDMLYGMYVGTVGDDEKNFYKEVLEEDGLI